MNIKTMIAAVSVVASTVVSAGVFTWEIEPAVGKQVNFVEFFSLADKTDPSDNSQKAAIRGSSWEGSSEWWESDHTGSPSSGFRWENGVLQAQSVGWDDMTKGNWYDVYQLKFIFNGTRTTPTFVTWSDVLNQVKSSGKFSTSTEYGTLTISNLPEPTSGLMLLLGAGMLALRRKQQVCA